LVNVEAAEMILEKDLSGKALAERIDFYAANPDDLHRMASRAGDFGQVDAAAAIVDDCYELIS
jgi:UDP-N-acetylglucosamine:LPS N-acetylglucosamine transferase